MEFVSSNVLNKCSCYALSFQLLSGRHGSFDSRGHFYDPLEHGGLIPIRKSQDAAVGALVRMLKKAPPLCQDLSLSQDPKTKHSIGQGHYVAPDSTAIQQPSSSIAYSKLLGSKTTADALEELRSYREMVKELLQNKGNLAPAENMTSGMASAS